MTQRQRFSADYKQEVVAMLDAPGVSVSQAAEELGIGVNVLGRWRREVWQQPDQTFPGQGRSRDAEVGSLRRELAQVTKERDFCEKRQRASRERRDEVSDDPTMPRGVSHPDDVPVFARVSQRILRLSDAAPQCPEPGKRLVADADCQLHTDQDGWSGAGGAGTICGMSGSGVGSAAWRV